MKPDTTLVSLSMRELDRLKVIEAVAEDRLMPWRAAERLGLTVRQVERLVIRYREHGPSGVASGRRGQPGNRKLDEGLALRALTIIRERYADFGPTLACEKLRCYVVVELKTTPFKPEYAGQLNFYLSVLDAQVKAPEDQPTIGLLLCKEKNRLVAEYALRGAAQPMGVAEYQLMREVPEALETGLPSIDQIEAELRPDLSDGTE